MKYAIVLSLIALNLLPGQAANANPPRYKLTVLPLTFFSLSRGGGYGINNKGQIVGDSTVDCIKRGNGQPLLLRLALWQKGKMQLLISAQTHLWMGMSSTAAGLNDRGQVLGNFQIISSGAWTYYGSHSFFWSKGQLTPIPSLPGDDYCEVRGLNKLGEAVGTSNKNLSGNLLANAPPGANLNASHAFIYSRGKTTWLGFGSANAINDQGQIIGDNGLWFHGHWTRLGMYPAAINKWGWIAGVKSTRHPKDRAHPQPVTIACLWIKGRMILLGEPGSVATALNGRGQIVGRVTLPMPRGLPEQHAVLWQGGRTYDLNHCVRLPQGWNLEEATGINDKGWIIGQGYADNKDPNNLPDSFTFLLTPK